MTVLREVTLCRRPGAPGGCEPDVLVLRVVWPCEGGACECRLEDGRGELRFAYRGAWRFLVEEEFDRVLAELLEEYDPAPQRRTATA